MRHRNHIDFITETGRPMRAVFVPGHPGARFQERPTVKFYDRTYNFTDDGQFTGASFYAETLMGHPLGQGLILVGGEPDWDVDAKAIARVQLALDDWMAL